MSCSQLTIYVDSDNLIRLEGLNKKIGGVESYVNGATVTVTALVDSDDVTVAGFTSFALSYVAASDGDYEGVLSEAINLTAEAEYTATVVATADGLTRTWQPSLIVKRDYQ